MKVQSFHLQRLAPIPPQDSLASHLLTVADAWARNNTILHITSLDKFLALLKREREWYLKDHDPATVVDVDIIPCWDGLAIKAQDSFFPAGQVQATFVN